MFKTPFICWCPQDCNTYVHCIGDRLWQFKADRNTRFICVNQLQMQCIQNYAAHLVTNTHKYDHIQPVLKHFHWLPVKQCIVFKILLITYIAVHGLAPPPYICELVQLKQAGHRLRSDNLSLLKIPKTRLKSYGDAVFSVPGSTEWNHLSEHIQSVLTIAPLISKLKTYLFYIAFDPIF